MCKFLETELEAGTISRVQEYADPFPVCGFSYIGKVTIRDEEASGERYLAFVIPATKVYNANGILIPNDKLVERLKVGSQCDYLFKQRDKDHPLLRITGLLIELRVRKASE
ncbi:hypothetical protein L0244_21205 [bacterium]|nr:hypothetical protein [bacterium]